MLILHNNDPQSVKSLGDGFTTSFLIIEVHGTDRRKSIGDPRRSSRALCLNYLSIVMVNIVLHLSVYLELPS